jgi:hypothetical protein
MTRQSIKIKAFLSGFDDAASSQRWRAQRSPRERQPCCGN